MLHPSPTAVHPAVSHTTVSLITPCVGDAPHVAATLRSVLEQQFAGLEYLVIGDVDSIRSSLPPDLDQRCIRWIGSPASNPVSLMNEALGHVTGDVVSWLLPGDLHFDDTLTLVQDSFERDRNLGVLYGDALELDAEGNLRRTIASRPFRHDRLERVCFFSQPTVFVRRAELDRVGGFDEQLKTCADYDLWLRLAAAGSQFTYVPRLLANELHSSASAQPFRRGGSDQLAMAEEVVAIAARQRGKVSRSALGHLGLIRALHHGPVPRGFFPLWAAAYKEAKLAAATCLTNRLTMPWEDLLLARRIAKIVRRHLDGHGEHLGGQSVPQQALRPKRFQVMRRRLGRLVHHAPRPLAIAGSYAQESAPPDPPVISIVTPSFNQAAFLEATLCSVLDQGYPRLEYVVQDGGSTDGSVDILRRHTHRLTAWESQRDRGQAHAVNLGMQRTTGSIMAYLNSDDLLLPGSLAYVARFFAEHPDVDVVYGHRILINDHGDEIGRWVLPPHDDEVIKYSDFIPQETMFWRRRAWDAVGGALDESFQFALDWDIILRFRQAGLRFQRLPRFLGAFRITEAQKTNTACLSVGRRESDRLRDRVLGFTPDSSTVRRRTKHYIRQHYMYDKLYLLGILRY